MIRSWLMCHPSLDTPDPLTLAQWYDIGRLPALSASPRTGRTSGTLAQLQGLFPEFAAPGITKSELLTAVLESTASQDINQRLKIYPEAASPNCLPWGWRLGETRTGSWSSATCWLTGSRAERKWRMLWCQSQRTEALRAGGT